MASALPIDEHLPAIRAAVRAHRAAVIVASPGAGKTTRVPPALADDGRVIVLQPRRVAARSIAKRIAEERGWTIGREVGWHVRFERQFTEATRLIVATEGILTARLQQDPLLSDVRTVILDEFHERSIHADLGLALARQAWLARDDLSLVVMSATLNAAPVSHYLQGCPVVDVPGTLHPLTIRYRPASDVATAVQEAAAFTPRRVLVFMPGLREVRDSAAAIRSGASRLDVAEIHGSLPSDEQDAALASTARVIVATNVAETSLTVPGVAAVVDSGLHKVARYDPERGVDSLHLERISHDSAEQRAGRAARLGAGLAIRLWAEHDRLRPHREPDIARIDLSGPVLDIVAWGGDPLTFDWFEPPARERLEGALDLLRQLGALDAKTLTALGKAMARLPLHPRLARILIEANGSQAAAIACAVLGDRHQLPKHPPTTDCDLAGLSLAQLPQHLQRAAHELKRAVRDLGALENGADLRRALFAGYPDRVARRRGAGDPRVLLSTGHGAVVSDESGVRDGEFLVALDVQSGRRGEGSEARIRIASIVDREWLRPTGTATRHELTADGRVQRVDHEMYGALVLRERRSPPDPVAAAETLTQAFLSRSLGDEHTQLLRRLRFAGIDRELEELVRNAAQSASRLDEIHLENGLAWSEKQQLDSFAPRRFEAPSGRSHALDYRDDGTVVLSIKLQELFGLSESPRIGPRGEPLLIQLLAPNGRPVQTTRDLASFWNVTYPDVRKELRGRYPKHPWPEDPWTAPPTARTKPSSRRGRPA